MNIAIVKENNFVREGIAKVLEDNFNCRVNCYDNESIKLMYEKKATLPEILYLGLDSFKLVKPIVNFCLKKGIKLVLWITDNLIQMLPKLLSKNIDGYFYSEMTTQELIIATKWILNGNKYIHPLLINKIQIEKKQQADFYNRPLGLMTKRQWDVLELISLGYPNKQIAYRLGITEKTVKNHVASILKKLDVNDRTGAAVYAIKKKWVDL